MKSILLLFFITGILWGDEILMGTGKTFTGTIISEDASNVVIQMEGMSFSLPKSGIKEIRRSNVGEAGNDIPTLEQILTDSKDSSTTEWVQIPATVIDDGVLKNVPYMSYRSGDLELNIYGDPAAPAGVEIGVYNSGKTTDASKSRFIGFILRLTHARFASGFNLKEDKKRLGNIDYEVTPATASDAYGGWWISAYDQVRLGQCRVSDLELNAISIKKSYQDKDKRELAERDAWTAQELARARPSVASNADASSFTPSYTESSGGYSGGRVYVRAYVRKDGTFVNSYTRRR